jgi:hypothetical protein
MGRFTDVTNCVFSVFGTTQWTATGIKAIPANFLGLNLGDEYIRISTLPSGDSLNYASISGVVQIDIFISAGKGPGRAVFIADKLDELLVGKQFTANSNKVQFYKSSVSFVGIDAGNTTLYRALYSIPFNSFGVNP